jgi:hydrogenase/urease accessory protein HupE
MSLALAALVATVKAHDPGISTAQGQLRAGLLELTNGFAPADVRLLLPATERASSKWTTEEFEAAKPRLLALAPQLWEMHSGTNVVPPRETRVALLPGDNVSFVFVFPLPATEAAITLRATRLADLPPGHRQFVIITDGSAVTVGKKLLSAADPSLEFSPKPAGSSATAEAAPPRFWGFLRLGIAHIWTGYDHLLFLFGLLVVCRTFRSIVTIISCFTLAHSLTLALATLNVVNLPPRLVEPAIAASIVFVGVENLWRRGVEPRGRWALTFGFGLIHGFGFASVLRDLGVGSGGQGLAIPLFTFNLGVEVGQVAVASIVLPIVWQLRKNERFVRQGVPILSGIVTVAGLYWFLDRTVFA